MDEEAFTDGIMFDGSSIAGWKGIDESDMKLMPDTVVGRDRPVLRANHPGGVLRRARAPDQRAVRARSALASPKAQAYLKQTGIGDTAVFGPEAEFFIFDDVRFTADPFNCGYRIDSIELPSNMGTEYEMGNLGHRPRTKGGYFPVPPVDRRRTSARRCSRSWPRWAWSSRSITTRWPRPSTSSASSSARWSSWPTPMQIYKYVIHNVAQAYGKTATASCRSRCSATTARACTATSRSGRAASRCSPATNTPTCPTWRSTISAASSSTPRRSTPSPTRLTNSYKRLVPGYEAPVLLAYSSRNRSASCRIPLGSSPKAKRVEVRFPDPAANPYLAFAAMLMAGLDGIENKINPGDPMDKNLYDLPPEELAKVPTVCGSLREACNRSTRTAPS